MSVVNRCQSILDGLRSRLTTNNNTPDFFQRKFFDEYLKFVDVDRRQDHDDAFDLLTRLKSAQRVDNDWDAVDFEKLLGLMAAETSALSAGHNDRDVHPFTTRCR